MKIIKTCLTAIISSVMIFSPMAYADKWSDQFPHIKATGDIPGECSYESMSKKNYKGKTLKINTHAVPVMGEPTALHAEQFAKQRMPLDKPDRNSIGSVCYWRSSSQT